MTNTIKYILDNKLQKQSFTGKVLWWSSKNNNGIIVMENGTEVYTDISGVNGRKPLSCGDCVSFNFNVKIMDCNCAINVDTVQ